MHKAKNTLVFSNQMTHLFKTYFTLTSNLLWHNCTLWLLMNKAGILSFRLNFIWLWTVIFVAQICFQLKSMLKFAFRKTNFYIPNWLVGFCMFLIELFYYSWPKITRLVKVMLKGCIYSSEATLPALNRSGEFTFTVTVLHANQTCWLKQTPSLCCCLISDSERLLSEEVGCWKAVLVVMRGLAADESLKLSSAFSTPTPAHNTREQRLLVCTSPE